MSPATIARTGLVRLRRMVVDHPGAYWLVVLAVGAAGAADVTARVAAVEQRREAWELTTAVVVARVAVAPGEMVDDSVTTLVALPQAAVPGGALTATVPGLVALDALAPGEVVLAHHVVGATPDDPGSSAARLAPGTVGVAVPVGPGGLSLTPGDHVTVFGTPDELGLDPGAGGGLLTASAEVIERGDDAVVLAVPDADAPAVARAAATGRTVVVLRRAPAPPTGPPPATAPSG